MGINDDDENSTDSKLSLDIFHNIFDKIDPNIKINSFEEAQGSGRGDNYTAALYRITLKGFIQNDEDNKKLKWEKLVICKRLPGCRAVREAYKSEALFRNEVEFYTTILPILIDFQKEKTKNYFKSHPHCYSAQNDLLILEDLCVRDFQMADRKAGLNLAQVECVLKELANFHALSLAYRAEHPKEFENLTKKISEGIFSTDNVEWYSDYYKVLLKSAIKMVKESLHDKPHYIEKLEEFCELFFIKMVELLNKKTNLAVICHGDCWTNNILYKYRENGDIEETCFVDFQLIRYGSLTLDLANVIFCCTESSLRKDNLNNLLKLYHRELVKYLQDLGGVPKSLATDENDLWNIIETEFKIYGKFGLGLAMDMLPISTCSPDEAPDLYVNRTEILTGAPVLNVPPNELCRRKMTELVVELVDAGMI